MHLSLTRVLRKDNRRSEEKASREGNDFEEDATVGQLKKISMQDTVRVRFRNGEG